MKDKEKIELKPCPFCGGEAKISKIYKCGSYVPRYYVCCSKCKTEQGKTYTTSTYATTTWNRRVVMKDKEKQIEEMAKVNHEKCGFCDTCDNCKYQWHEDCEKIKYATNIYNAGYRKIPKDARVFIPTDDKYVLLSREEKNALWLEAWNKATEQASKETAEKFAKMAKDRWSAHWESYCENIDELAKQFGVEIKE